MTRRDRHPGPELELHVVLDGNVIIGPIQAVLLEAIQSSGSISAAHRALGISYAHVWKLVAAMNAIFSPPLVEPIRGGARGGGATLTQQGYKVLNSYRRLEGLSRDRVHAELLAIGKAAGHVEAERQGA